MEKLKRHWARICVTLLPLLLALVHATGLWQFGLLTRLDDVIYDARLRATMPNTLDPRIVIVDLDEKSLGEVGRWPWGRDKVAALNDEIFGRQQAAVVGFDVVFGEPDASSGLARLKQLAANELKDQAGFSERIAALETQLDYDGLFAKSLEGKRAVLGYYLTADRDGRKSGVLPEPIMTRDALKGRPISFLQFDGYGSNIPQIAKAAPIGGFFNSIVSDDGVVRSIPFVAQVGSVYHEALALAMFRSLLGNPAVEPGFPQDKFVMAKYQGLESIRLRQGKDLLAIPVDHQVGVLIPFRGAGGSKGGSYQYVSAADVLSKKLPAGSLKDKLVIVGSTAPGLLDLRVTPVAEVYPGVEVHANVLSGLLDDKIFVKPDFALGFEVLILMLSGLALAVFLPLLTASRAVVLSAAVLATVVALNFWLFMGAHLVMPLASSLFMVFAAFALNMSYGYFVESKSKRDLANLFRGYVPPELVDEMVEDPESYNMKAVNKELTVMFCDMRGFTTLSEKMEPTALQALLNNLFSRLTEIIQANRGTTDKYMGDCVMAFWGAPVGMANHAQLAVKAALEMSNAVRKINAEHRAQGIPEIGVGVGVNTGVMCVGNMGSDIRRSYTVIGDAVNLGSRLEGLSKTYGVDIVVSDSTKKACLDFTWQELDKVRVKGKDVAVTIHWPMGPTERLDKSSTDELKTWQAFLKCYRQQDWDQCDIQMLNLERMNAKKYLYELYAQRVSSMKMLPFDPSWDGATNFDSK